MHFGLAYGIIYKVIKTRRLCMENKDDEVEKILNELKFAGGNEPQPKMMKMPIVQALN